MDDRLRALVVMRMRYKIPRDQAIAMGEAWLAANPSYTWTQVHDLLQSSRIVVVGDQLVVAGGASLSQVTAAASSNKPQGMKYRGRPVV
ncbi:MAG: hypothetical protein HC934_09020 [Acaryochloridaceae cyanobacterium SU_2_1]|nr:hypothetical protein [Acaryochloridaceae cyanobacterium SU_2_1]